MDFSSALYEKISRSPNLSFHKSANDRSGMACEKINCSCHFCKGFQEKNPNNLIIKSRKNTPPNEKPQSPSKISNLHNLKNEKTSENDFIFLLHRMKLSPKCVDYFKIPIADTVTILKGVPTLLIFNSDDVNSS